MIKTRSVIDKSQQHYLPQRKIKKVQKSESLKAQVVSKNTRQMQPTKTEPLDVHGIAGKQVTLAGEDSSRNDLIVISSRSWFNRDCHQHPSFRFACLRKKSVMLSCSDKERRSSLRDENESCSKRGAFEEPACGR